MIKPLTGPETLTREPPVSSPMSERAVDAEDVAHVAGLARIELTEEEIEGYRDDFAEILAYFDRLDEVPETESTPDRLNVMREDTPRTSLSQAEALENAEETEDGYFKGPTVS